MYRIPEKNLFDNLPPIRYKRRHKYSYNLYFVNDFKDFFTIFKMSSVFSGPFRHRKKRRSRTGPGLGVRTASVLAVFTKEAFA